VVLLLRGWVSGQQLCSGKKKISMLRNVTQGFGLEQSLWKDLSSGKFENKGAVEDIWA